MINDLSRLLLFTMLLLPLGCSSQNANHKMPYDHWYLDIVYPQYMEAEVVYTQTTDVRGDTMPKLGFGSTGESTSSLGRWHDSPGSGGERMFRVLPRTVSICWDSWVDRKTYWAQFTLPDSALTMMTEPLTYTHPYQGYSERRYRIYLRIGLEPGGGVIVWLDGAGETKLPIILRSQGVTGRAGPTAPPTTSMASTQRSVLRVKPGSLNMAYRKSGKPRRLVDSRSFR